MNSPLDPSSTGASGAAGVASQAALIQFIRKQSYREGDFTLASGKKSKFYIDLKATTLHPEGAYLIGELAVRELLAQSLKIQGVGGLTLGADPLATAISLSARAVGLLWPAFIVRKESKGHGTGKYIEGVENLTAGAEVVVLEDVVTTGGSSIIAIYRLRAEGYRPTAVLTVVDREEGGAEKIRDLGLKFYRLATLTQIQEAR